MGNHKSNNYKKDQSWVTEEKRINHTNLLSKYNWVKSKIYLSERMNMVIGNTSQ